MTLWDEVARGVESGDVTGEEAKIGLGVLGLMHEVLNPGERAPAPVDRMVDDVLAFIVGDDGGAPETRADTVAAFVKGALTKNPLLVRFGAELGRRFGAAEEQRKSAARDVVGAAKTAPPPPAEKGTGLSPLAARIAQMKH